MALKEAMEKRKQMQAIVAAYHKSTISQKQFAANAGISIHKLKYWLHWSKKFKQEADTRAGFIPLPTTALSQEASDCLEIAYPNGVKLKVPTGNLSFISQLIKVY